MLYICQLQSPICIEIVPAIVYNACMVMAIKHKSEMFYTPREASEYLGYSEDTIRRYINRRLIDAVKHGTTWAISKTELDRYSERKKGRGRPRKKV